MTARVSDYKDSLYYREYANDAPPQLSLVTRVVLASLPFFWSLYRPLRMPIALSMGSLRVWNTEEKWQKAGAVVALASTVFKFRTGQILTTVQDIVLGAKALKNCQNREEAVGRLIGMLNNLVYLALISRGGLELSIAAFAIQTVMNLVQSRDEFKKGRWIEGCADLLVAAIRLGQTHSQYQLLQRNREIEKAIRKLYVGELHEKWRFPSDHLPVGIEVNGVRILSWNVLNNAYIEWVTEKDSQGLNGSLIN
jgi:hypothetical protein